MKITNIFFITMSLLLFISCMTNKENDIGKKQINNLEREQQQKHCNDEFITVNFLKELTYKKAIEQCNLTILDRELKLKDIASFGIRSNFSTHFSKEELLSSKKFKEVKWESKDLDYIIVWYLKEGEDWKPFDYLKYDKDTRF